MTARPPSKPSLERSQHGRATADNHIHPGRPIAAFSGCGTLRHLLGIDREIRGFAAGIRTHALVSLSSALITISALMLYQEIRE
ncbi:MAG: MgtC/SapB family protein, partial [Rhodoplanes sp.]